MKTKKIYVGYRGMPLPFNGVLRLTLKKALKCKEAEKRAESGEFSNQDFEEDLNLLLKRLPVKVSYAYFVRKKEARKWAEKYAYR